MNKENKVIRLGKSNFHMRLFMLKNLPLAFFAGLRVIDIGENKALVSIPYKFLNKNPFRSIYFAALSMAAELSTGILAMAAISEVGKPVSMLVLEMKASFKKKATGKIIFICEQGGDLHKAVQKSIQSNEGQVVAVKSIGIDTNGIEVAEFEFIWTFKAK